MNPIIKAAAAIIVSAHAAEYVKAPSAQPALSAREASVLGAALKGGDRGSMTVACAGPWCRDLAGGVAKLFEGAGWTVHKVDHGGLGIDGVSGIRVNYCGVNGRKIRDALGQASSRQVETVEDTACNTLTDREIYVVVGLPR